ncbi:MAG: hypothetical protein QOI15_2860 [Pseudonocardiales bacterium]|nr:hypothetical protein [Pseudonocardiales bacterium]
MPACCLPRAAREWWLPSHTPTEQLPRRLACCCPPKKAAGEPPRPGRAAHEPQDSSVELNRSAGQGNGRLEVGVLTTGFGSPEEELDDAEFSRIAGEVLDGLPFPALVLEVPSQRIVVSSPAAADLIDPAGGVVVGHLFEEFMADRPALGIGLLAGGRLNGFETFRVLRRQHAADVKVRMWIRSFDRQPASRFVVVVLLADDVDRGQPAADWQEAPAVVGTTNASLRIERISSDAEELFARPVIDLVGASLLTLVAEADVASLLSGLGEASTSEAGISLYQDLRPTAEGLSIRCELLLLPLQPKPSCAFVFLPTSPTMAGTGTADLSTILLRLGHGAHIAQLARGVFRGITETAMPGVSRLTTRELEIATRLLDGDRPPEIARNLFLSQSTVRNHLASVFVKLGVTSQQGLLNLAREAQSDLESQ